MKHRVSLFVLICAFFSVLGCDFDVSNEGIPNNEFDRNGTLQGSIFDATTGERLKGESLSVTLIKGTSYKNPSLLKKDESETVFAGDYAFNDIPVTLYNSATYRLVATLDGYQQFEAYITMNATSPISGDNDGDNNQTIDTVYNMIGNIYMFPLGETAPDYYVYVESNGVRVPGATVQLHPNIKNNAETTLTDNTLRQTGTSGNSKALIATTNEKGMATFSGNALVLGGAYTPVVLPMVFENDQLMKSTGNELFIGMSENNQTIRLTRSQVPDNASTTSDNNTSKLYVMGASNQNVADVNPSGMLTITFNKPISLVDESLFSASLTNATSASLQSDPVTVSISPDGKVMTLTPNWATTPVLFDGSNADMADINLQISYSGGQIYDNAFPSTFLNILSFGNDNVTDLLGLTVSPTVYVTSS